MERYNYREVMKADIREWLNDYESNDTNTFDDIYEDIYDQLWGDNNVTGNGGDWYD